MRRNAGRLAAILAAAIGATLMLVVFGIVIAALVVDGNDIKGPLARAASKYLERPVDIAELQFDLGRRTRVRAEGLRVANVEWSRQGDLVKLGVIDFQVDVWPLLSGRIVIPSLELRDVSVNLQRRKDGTANWTFGGSGSEDEPEDSGAEPGELPLVEQVSISNARVQYRDETTEDSVDVLLTTLQSRYDAGEDRMHVDGHGRYQGQTLKLKVTTAGPDTLRRGQSVPLMAALTAGDLEADAEGSVDPKQLQSVDVDVRVAGKNMGNLWPLVGVPLPNTPPYRISGKLIHEQNWWRLRNFDGKLGDSDLNGTLSIDITGRKPTLIADVRSQKLDLADLKGFLGADLNGEGKDSGKGDKQQAQGGDGHLLPNKAVELKQLQAVNGQITWKARQIITPKLPLDTFELDLSLKDSVLRLQPLGFGIGKGRVLTYLSLDGNQMPPKVDFEGTVSQVNLRDILRDTPFVQESAGILGGKIKLTSTGASIAEALGRADGEFFLIMSDGRISHLLVELAGLDVAESLGIAVSGDKPVSIRCIVADFTVQDGLATTKTLLLDTTDSNVIGEGTINLASEALDLKVRTLPKDFSPLTLRKPILVGGTLASPDIFPDPAGIGNETAVKKAFNAVLTAVLGLLPPIDTAVGENHQCGKLLEEAKRVGK